MSGSFTMPPYEITWLLYQLRHLGPITPATDEPTKMVSFVSERNTAVYPENVSYMGLAKRPSWIPHTNTHTQIYINIYIQYAMVLIR